MSKPLLYLSPDAAPDEKVAKLTAETFVQRLQDLSDVVQSLNELRRLMRVQNERDPQDARGIQTENTHKEPPAASCQPPLNYP